MAYQTAKRSGPCEDGGREEDLREPFWDEPGDLDHDAFDDDPFACVLGDACIVADPVHLSSECHGAADAEAYHRDEWLRSEVLEHGASVEGALVLERALVRILASAGILGERATAAEDPAPYERALFEAWPNEARRALGHRSVYDGASRGPHERLVERLMDLREALHRAEGYEDFRSQPDHETFHDVCVAVPDLVRRALEGPANEAAAEPEWEPENDSDLPF